MEELNEIYNDFSKINYGWLDTNNILHVDNLSGLYNTYRMSTMEEIKANMYASCLDQVEYIRTILDDRYEVLSYVYMSPFLIHAIPVIIYKDKYVLFENISYRHGLYVFDDLDSLLEFGYEIFLNDLKMKSKNKTILLKYDAIKEDMTYKEIKEYFMSLMNEKEKELILR